MCKCTFNATMLTCNYKPLSTRDLQRVVTSDTLTSCSIFGRQVSNSEHHGWLPHLKAVTVCLQAHPQTCTMPRTESSSAPIFTNIVRLLTAPLTPLVGPFLNASICYQRNNRQKNWAILILIYPTPLQLTRMPNLSVYSLMSTHTTFP